MDTERFAPPRAQVNDVALAADGFQPIRLWPPSGRIGRLRLMAYSLGLYAAFIGVSVVIGILGGITGSVAGSSAGSMGAGVLGVVAFIVYLVAGVSLVVQRSHDMDLSGWWSILSFVPLAFLFWILNPGSRGANRWGAPPPPNSGAVKFFGLVFPILALIGMVAVIAAIALPAYQGYTSRANAAAAAPR